MNNKYERMTLTEKIEFIKGLIANAEKENNEKGVVAFGYVLESLEESVERVKRIKERIEKKA